eukprot:4457093-Pyramimonas_sp.AAC.1
MSSSIIPTIRSWTTIIAICAVTTVADIGIVTLYRHCLGQETAGWRSLNVCPCRFRLSPSAPPPLWSQPSCASS